MCGLCSPLPRRNLLAGALAFPFGHAHSARPPGLLEPSLHLPNRSTPPTVAITLDACPGKFDSRIAETLVTHAIPATIFLTNIWMRWNPDGLAYLKSRPDLFSLQNHGANHLPAVLGTQTVYGLTPAGTLPAIKQEILAGAAAITQATGKPPRWYRGAAGLYSPQALPLIAELGFQTAGYSINADQGASLPAKTVAARILAAQDGDVIEGHINQPHRDSGAGIAAGLVALKNSGMRFVKLEESSHLL
jgi:peptidoglycan/xylan/chitin deacetylase (PgdA/CDA1 family)